MQYRGRHPIFDPTAIAAYPLRTRTNKVALGDLLDPAEALRRPTRLAAETVTRVEAVAEAVVAARAAGRPVVLFTGAHLIKNGLGPLLADLVRRGRVTLVAGNGATAIHDFELALIGATSEHVPNALGQGQFGMAYEFAYLNVALQIGNRQGLGYGESLGRMIGDAEFRAAVLAAAARAGSPREFAHPEISVLAACHQTRVPFTVHVGIGTDVSDQHPSFDGEAKGGCSGRDFLIYVNELAKLTEGGVVINVGSAVTGPEVLLKAVSMAANTGRAPRGIVTADFDLRPYRPDQMDDEAAPGYYYRDQKSVATRIPQAFAGRGFYVEGDEQETFVLLCQKVCGPR